MVKLLTAGVGDRVALLRVEGAAAVAAGEFGVVAAAGARRVAKLLAGAALGAADGAVAAVGAERQGWVGCSGSVLSGLKKTPQQNTAKDSPPPATHHLPLRHCTPGAQTAVPQTVDPASTQRPPRQAWPGPQQTLPQVMEGKQHLPGGGGCPRSAARLLRMRLYCCKFQPII
jgi:hypothetical protein